MENKQNNRVVIISSGCFNAFIWSLFVFTLFAILFISLLIIPYAIVFTTTFPKTGNDWTNFVSAFLCSFVLIGGLIWPTCHFYKLSKIILEDDEIILRYSFISFFFYCAFFRLTPEEKKCEKRRYIEEKGKKKFFRFSFIYKYHLKCSEIVGYESLGSKSIRTNKLGTMGFLTLSPVNKKTGKKITKHVYRKIPLRDAYTKVQMFYILTRIRENGGLQGDAYDDAIKQVSVTHKNNN